MSRTNDHHGRRMRPTPFTRRLMGWLVAALLCLFTAPAMAETAEEKALRHPICQEQTWTTMTVDKVDRAIDKLLAAGQSIDSLICPPMGDSMLHMAARTAPVPIIERLIAAGADPNVLGGDKCTPLCRAMIWGNNDAVTSLSRAGALPHLETTFGTPLHRALLFGDPKTIARSLQIVKAAGHVFTGRDVAHALRNPNPQMIESLVTADRDVIFLKLWDSEGNDHSWGIIGYSALLSPNSATVETLINLMNPRLSPHRNVRSKAEFNATQTSKEIENSLDLRWKMQNLIYDRTIEERRSRSVTGHAVTCLPDISPQGTCSGMPVMPGVKTRQMLLDSDRAYMAQINPNNFDKAAANEQIKLAILTLFEGGVENAKP